MSALPALPVAVPLIMAALLAGLDRLIPRRASFLAAIATALATFCLCIALFHESLADTIVYWFGNWQPRNGIALGISFVIDPIGAGFASLACILTLAALIFSARYFDTIGTLFHVLMLSFMGAMCGFSLTGDLFNLFVFFELMSASAYALCGYKTEDPAPVQGALNFAVTNTTGAYFILIGIGLLYARTGALNLAQIGRTLDGRPGDALVLAAFTFITCGYFVKAAVVPFHFWLADAHAVAPTPVCILFSGVMVELGLYAVARLYWTIFAGPLAHVSGAVRAIFVFIGVFTAITGAVMCYAQRNLKRLLAFSTISHMGLMVLGFGMLNADGLAGCAVYILSHAGAKGGLFLAAGIVLHRMESVDEFDLAGKLRELPFAAVAFLCGSVALAGAPWSGMELGTSLVHRGAGKEGCGWIVWVFIISAAITAGAVLRFVARTFAGLGPKSATPNDQANKTEEQPETTSGHDHTSVVMWAPAILLTLGGLCVTAAPGLYGIAWAAAARFTDHAGYIRRVLEGAPARIPATAGNPAGEPMHGTIALMGAIALAFVALKWKPPKPIRNLAELGRVFRNLHSGHVGDYVAWLTFGVASFGVASLFFLRS